MQQAFHTLFDIVAGNLHADEVLLGNFAAETSDFVRFNKSSVRQAGNVRQRQLQLELIRGKRHVASICTLSGVAEEDAVRAQSLLAALRDSITSVPDDPYLLYNTTPTSTQQVRENRLPDSGQMVDAILQAGHGLDLVGILATGGIVAGFANSLGQRNWFATHSYNFDWCFYHTADKAVKSSYAGFEWDQVSFARRMDQAREQLAVLARPPRTIPPGQYRAYIAPAALREITNVLSWDGFGIKALRTKTSSMMRMIEAGECFSSALTIRENTAEGLAPNFHSGGFIRPASVTMIESGRFKDPLVSPRSAKEFGLTPTGSEFPVSLDMAAGDIPADQVLARLGTGVYINRLWYLNYSDRPACRMTGMTRFATFWVENGQITAPLNVMRFDETAYNMLGRNLIGLTATRDLLPDEQTYGSRSVGSSRLPGALVDNFTFTL